MITYRSDQARSLILSGKLPSGATVDGSLYLDGCDVCFSLKSLPEDLTVLNLALYKCKYINTIPKGLKVSRVLYISGCTELKDIPEDLSVGRMMVIEGCPSIKLPKGIPLGIQGCIIVADEVFFRSNKKNLLLLINCVWGNEDTKASYFKILSEG